MMKVQRGQVKYKDRNDIICTYGIAEDGKQYYFLNEEKLENGNLLASTALVEAIDPLVVASNIGVISAEGKVVVPFNNKSIKLISDQALLVERATPTTQSVIDALNMRKDPLSATKLVTTPATIKDRMNAKMGQGGRFVFNDQFSEATVVDLDGNNLVGNEYYSFIGIHNNTLYMSKNTVDSVISEYKIGDDKEEKEEKRDPLNVADAVVAKEVIDQAMQGVVPVVPVAPVMPIIPPVPFDAEVNKEEEQEEKKLHPIDLQVIEVDKDENSVDGTKIETNKDEDSAHNTKQEKETRVSLFEGLTFDEKEKTNELITPSMAMEEGEEDSIIEDTADTLSKLIKKNREQKRTISIYEEKIDDLISFKKQAFNENQRLIRDNDNFKKRVEELEDELVLANEKIEKLKTQLAGKDDLVRLLDDAKDLLDE